MSHPRIRGTGRNVWLFEKSNQEDDTAGLARDMDKAQQVRRQHVKEQCVSHPLDQSIRRASSRKRQLEGSTESNQGMMASSV